MSDEAQSSDLYQVACVCVGLIGLISIALGFFGGSMFGFLWDATIVRDEQRESYGLFGLALRSLLIACATATPGVLLIRFRREVASRWLLPESGAPKVSKQVPLAKLAFALLGTFLFLDGVRELINVLLVSTLMPASDYPALLSFVSALVVVGTGVATVRLSGWLSDRLSP